MALADSLTASHCKSKGQHKGHDSRPYQTSNMSRSQPPCNRWVRGVGGKLLLQHNTSIIESLLHALPKEHLFIETARLIWCTRRYLHTETHRSCLLHKANLQAEPGC